MYKQIFTLIISLSLISSSSAEFTLFKKTQVYDKPSPLDNCCLKPLAFTIAGVATIGLVSAGYQFIKCYYLDKKPARELINESRDALKRIKQIHNALLCQPVISQLPEGQERMVAEFNFKKTITNTYEERHPFITCKNDLRDSINECITILEKLERRIDRIKDGKNDHKGYLPKLERLKVECYSLIDSLTAIKNEVVNCYEYTNECNMSRTSGVATQALIYSHVIPILLTCPI